jgi:hypothetical protein
VKKLKIWFNSVSRGSTATPTGFVSHRRFASLIQPDMTRKGAFPVAQSRPKGSFPSLDMEESRRSRPRVLHALAKKLQIVNSCSNKQPVHPSVLSEKERKQYSDDVPLLDNGEMSCEDTWDFSTATLTED